MAVITPTGSLPIQPVDVSTPSSAHTTKKAERELIRDLLAGTKRMREKAEVYLPKNPRELDSNYRDRISKATLTNVTGDSIANVVSRPFAKPVQVNEDVSDKAAKWLKDVDLRGNNITQFARAAFDDGISDGLVHVLVDYRTVPGALSREAELKAGARPYLVLIPADRLIAAYMEMVDGQPYCIHARIYETAMERRDYGEVQIERIREYNPFEVKVWRRDNIKGTGWILEEQRPFAWPWVPLYTFYAGKPVTDFVIDPPFMDLAYKNVEHFQVSSAYQTNLDRCNFAMLAVEPVENAGSPVEQLSAKATDPEGSGLRFEVGPDTVLVGKWYYVEPSAAGLKETAARLDQMKIDMRLMGLDPMVPKATGGVTATESAIEESKSQSQLIDWTSDFSDVLDKAINFAMLWEGEVEEIDATINSDFMLVIDSTDIASLMQMRATGDLSRATLWEESQRRGLLGPKFDAEAEEALLETESFAQTPIVTPDTTLTEEGDLAITDETRRQDEKDAAEAAAAAKKKVA